MSFITAAATKRHKKYKCSVRLFAFFALLCGIANAQTRVSILDFGSTAIAKRAADTLRSRFRSSGEVQVADADLTRAAAKGIGYSGSLNLSIIEARDLGAALATEFYLIGDAQTLRRSSFKTPVYY